MKILNILFLCHRRPDRSFFFRGKQFPLCARCTGILIGYIVGIMYILFLKANKGLLSFSMLLFIIPITIDGMGQLYRKWESTNIRRCTTGILAGTSIDIFIYFVTIIDLFIIKSLHLYF